MKNKIFFFLLFTFILVSNLAYSKPFLLNYSDVDTKIFHEKNPVSDFIKEYTGQAVIKKSLKMIMEAMKNGEYDPNDKESDAALTKKLFKSAYKEAFALRKTLKTPQMKFLLDNEIVNLLGQEGRANTILKFINKLWAGTSRQYLALTGIEQLQINKFDNYEKLKEILRETKIDENTDFGKKLKITLSGFLEKPAGKLFPEFPAGKKTTDGKDLNLARFKGKILLVDFWASWCPPCRAETHNLVSAYDCYQNDGFEIIGISFDKDKTQFQNYIKENNMRWPQYFDGKGWRNEIGPSYAIRSIPTMYLIGKDGKVITNDLRGGKLEKVLGKLFN